MATVLAHANNMSYIVICFFFIFLGSWFLCGNEVGIHKLG